MTTPAPTPDWHWPELPFLLKEWHDSCDRKDSAKPNYAYYISRRAADWQLEQVCAWMCDIGYSRSNAQALREAMRPARPATAATALAALDEMDRPLGCVTASRCQRIRLALQRLQKLEQEAGQ